MATKKVVFEIDIKGTKEALELQKRIKELKSELKKSKDPMLTEALLKDLAIAQIELKKAQAAARLAQKEFEAQDSTIGSYKQLSAQLTVARERFKNLATEAERTGVANKDAIDKARKEAVTLNNQLSKIDQATGVFGRNVGNYAGSLKGLFANLKQSITATGILGRGGLMASVGLLAGAYNKLSTAIDIYSNATSASYRANRLVAAQQDELISNYVEQRAQSDLLFKTAKGEIGTKEEQAAAIAAINEQYAPYLENQLTETSNLAEIEAAQKAVNAAIIENIVKKQEAILIEKALEEAIKSELELEKQRKAEAEAFGKLAGEGGVISAAYNAIATSVAETDAATAKATVVQTDFAKTIRKALTDIQDLGFDYSKAYGGTINDLTKKTDATAKKLASDAKKEAERAQKEALDRRKKFAEQVVENEKKQVDILIQLQIQLSQAIVDNIEDVNLKAQAVEKLQFEQRTQQQLRSIEETKANLKAQNDESVKIYGEGSKEAEAVIAANNKHLQDLQAIYAKLDEEELKAHNMRLSEIDKQAAEQRTQKEKDAAAAAIAEQESQTADLQRVYEYRLSVINESLEKGTISNREAAKRSYEAQKQYIQAEIELIKNRLSEGIFASEAEKQDAVLKMQQLNEALAKLEKDQTATVQDESKKRAAARQKAFEQAAEFTSRAISAVAGLADALYAKEEKQVQQQIDNRQKNISDLENQLSNATGLEKEFLEQKLEREKKAAEDLAAQKAAIEKKAAKTRKGVAIAQAIINTAISVTQALSTPPGVPYTIPFGVLAGALGAVEIATIAAQPLATGGKVGTHINGQPIQRSNGDNVLTTLKTGEAVLTEGQQRFVGHDLLAAAGVPGFAEGGIANIPNIPNTVARRVGGYTAANETILQQQKMIELLLQERKPIEVVYTPNTQKAIDSDMKDRAEIKTTSKLMNR